MAHSELWNALGLQISKSLRSQLGITIPGLGQFGFVAPEIPIDQVYGITTFELG